MKIQQVEIRVHFIGSSIFLLVHFLLFDTTLRFFCKGNVVEGARYGIQEIHFGEFKIRRQAFTGSNG